MRRSFLFFSLTIFFFANYADAQVHHTAGGYTTLHYGVKSYRMHPRNFAISQSEKELMYFGNAYGVIEYDGNGWKNIPLPNGNSGLSFGLGPNKKLYVGSYNELGFLSSDSTGSTIYQSLYNKIPTDENKIGTVRDIFFNKEAVIYFSQTGLYCYQTNFEIIHPTVENDGFAFAKQVGQTIYVQEKSIGLQMLKRNKLEMIKGGEAFKNINLKDIIQLDKSHLLILGENGLSVFDYEKIIPLEGKANQVLKQQQLTDALLLQNGNILITTSSNGFYVVSLSGNIIKHISLDNGLQSNNITCAYTDKNGGLWLALDNGISYIEINTPFSFIGFPDGVAGLGYTAAIFDDKLYLGTSQGLFYSEWKGNLATTSFKQILSGQISDLSVIGNTLLCCQTDHTYQIKGNTARLIPSVFDGHGQWKIIPLRNKPGYALKGTYEGFQLYKLDNGNWQFLRKLAGFEESSRVFVEDHNGSIWMCHGNKGIYEVTLADDLTRIKSAVNYNEKLGLAPDFFNEITYVNDALIFSANDGPYVFNIEKNAFEKEYILDEMFGRNIYINKIIQTNDKNIWVFTGDDVHLHKYIAPGKFVAEKNVFRKLTGQLVGSYEFAMPVSSQLAVIGSQEGFIFFNLKDKVAQHEPYQLLVRKVESSFENTLLYGGNNDSTVRQWKYGYNSLRISFAAQYFENPEKLTYQYALAKKGDETLDWSGWTSNTQVDFSELFEGDYILHLKARNIYQQEAETSFAFSILPPWYRSIWAFMFYVFVLLCAGLLLFRFVKNRFRVQKEKLENQKQKELLIMQQEHLTTMLQNEKELIALRNEKLEAEVVLKNNELASLATALTQKTEFLSQLKDKLEVIHKDTDNGDNLIFKEVIKTIDQDLDFDDNWGKFQLHFDQLHNNFLHRLRQKYPKLNPSWLLLCAYIRMNKANKDIAAHMNISVAGVEKRKYRLREKLEIENEERLSDFISTF